MAKKITISDTNSKYKCIEYLGQFGYKNLRIAGRNDNCDLIGYKNNIKYYFEVKFSSKKLGKFFGCVMLTEIYFALKNKPNYRFIVCRGESNDIKKWFFKIFTVDEFIKLCTLTTPIFHYHIYFDNNHEVNIPNFEKKTVIANENLVIKMWDEFQKWKNKKP